MTSTTLAAVTTALGLASGALAQTIITFDELAPGTAILGESIDDATFTSFLVPSYSATIQDQGVPDDGVFGQGAWLVGPVTQSIEITFARPMRSASLSYVMNDTVHSSAGVRFTAMGFHGITLATSYFVHEGFASWPGDMAIGGSAGFTDLDGIQRVQIEFAPVLGTLAAIDNLTFTPLTGCLSDYDGDGDSDGIDVGLFLQLYSQGNTGADLDNDGDVDGIDVGLFLQSHGGGC